MSVEGSAPATVAAASIKLPPFWPTDPEVWFLQVEAQFSTRGVVSQKTRFEYIISSLSPEIVTEVRDLLLSPPTDNPYDVLKAELIRRTAASEQKKLQQLLGGEELGDRKPSQLLRRMQQLLGDKLGSSPDTTSLLRELFLQRLPANVRMVLASVDSTTDLLKVAEMADKILEVAAPTTIATLSTELPPTPPSLPHPVSSPSSDIQQLREEVARLTSLVQSMSSRHRSPRKSRRRSASPAAQSNNDQPTLCWYHHKFGEAARNCKAPCSWSGNPQAGN